VELTLPYFVETIEPGAPAALEQFLKACGGRIEYHRAHMRKRTAPPQADRRATAPGAVS